MLLVVGALALLSTIALSLNQAMLINDETAFEAQFGMMAVSLSQGQIEALAATDFDSLNVGVSTQSLATPLATFVCTTRVDYVQAATPDVAVSGPTSLKRVSVEVGGAYMTGEVSLSAIVGDY